MKFSAHLDTSVKLITGLFIFIILLSTVLVVVASDASPIALIISALLISIVLGVYLYRIKGYRLDNDSLDILRPLGAKSYMYTDIKSVRLLEDADMKGLIRTFGNGGVWGYTGHFYNKTLGSIYLYMTQKSPAIMLTLNNSEKIVLSPDDASTFISELNTRLA